VLVVDVMHGLEAQTKESIRLLTSKNTPFCVALNKIDRLNQWEVHANMNSRDTLDKQNTNTTNHFDARLGVTKLAFAEEALNVELYWNNESLEDTLSLVPTSAITGEGLCDLITNLVKMGQTSEREKLTEKKNVFECTVLEVKVIDGHGTTVDVVLVNGVLKVGDTVVLSGLNGPIRTKIRALLTPQPMKEMRVKGAYIRHEKIKGAMGIKLSAPGLEDAIAGSELFKCNTEEEVEDAIAEIEGDICDILDKYVDKNANGVCVQASTIGSLEALLEFLYQSKIPVTAVNIGPIHKKDILKA
jgi:translation initiation factor 5B